MTTKTITASATFTDEQIIVFAMLKGYQENITIGNGDLVPNDKTPFDFISEYYKTLFANDIQQVQETVLLQELEVQKQKMLEGINKGIEDNLTVTVE